MNGWKKFDWTTVRFKVFKWQQEIYLASISGDIRQVRMLQNLILRSKEAKLFAVCQVMQSNIGKFTSRDENIRKIWFKECLEVVSQLKFPAKKKTYYKY